MTDYFSSKKYQDSKERIKKAFNFEIEDFSQVPLVLQTNSYWLTGHDPDEIPDDYFDNPASMLKFQEEGIAQHLRRIAGELREDLPKNRAVVVCAKGIEKATGKLMGEVVHEALPQALLAVLSGPSFAADVARGLPASVTLACEDEATGRAIPAEPYHDAVKEGLAVDLSDKFVVHWSKNRPDDAYLAVKHRGTWFYIDDGDFHSKFFFAGLYDLFNIEVIPPSDSQGPILTIPVN